jgi:hypothetical protein
MQSLRRLKLCDPDRTGVSFQPVVAILETFGSISLEEVALESVIDVDVAALFKFCSNLVSLELTTCRFISHLQASKPGRDLQMLNLKHLSVLDNPYEPVIDDAPLPAE